MIEFGDGKIKTDLSDMGFIERILRTWGDYTRSEAEVLVNSFSSQELSDDWLMQEGVSLNQGTHFVAGEEILLKKVGHHEWTVKDYSDSEMEAFVDLINGDADPSLYLSYCEDVDDEEEWEGEC